MLLAVGMGIGNQFQMKGSAIVLAIGTSVFNGYTRARLQEILGTSHPDALYSLGTSLSSMPTQTQEDVRLALAVGYNRQMLVLCGAAVAQVPIAFLLWKRNQIKV